MPTKDERLRQVTLKVERAKEHILDLNGRVKTFLETNPYEVRTKREPQSGKLIYYLSVCRPTPDCLALVAGDVVQNLMSALDHLAYQLVCSDTADNPPDEFHIYFPIAKSQANYTEAFKCGQIQGASQATIDAIDLLKPYKGGNDLLWSLKALNNVEKHRLLITVGSAFQRFNFGTYMQPTLERMTADMLTAVRKVHPDEPGPGPGWPGLDVFFVPSDKMFPLKAGDELFIGLPEDEPNEKIQFVFDVALTEPKVIEAQSLLETLHQMTTLVEGIVSALSHRLV